MRIWEVLIFKLAKIYPDYASTLDRHSASSSMFICQMCSVHSTEAGVLVWLSQPISGSFPHLNVRKNFKSENGNTMRVPNRMEEKF